MNGKQNKLCLTCLTKEQSTQHHGYNYLITRRAVSYTAFRTRKGLTRWLTERGLILPEPLPDDGVSAFMLLIGHFYENMTFKDLPNGIEAKQLSNGRYTRATITSDPDDCARVINYQNPNVTDRIEYDKGVTS